MSNIPKFSDIKKTENTNKLGAEPTAPKSAFIRNNPTNTIEKTLTEDRARRLYGDFWFEGEVCMFYADTNVGKSIMSVQIADAIAKGYSHQQSQSYCPFVVETPAQPVLYFDMELSDAQFTERYADKWQKGTGYQFSPNFIRCVQEITAENASFKNAKEYEEFLMKSIELEIVATGAKVLIVDNITAIKMDSSQGKDAGELMRTLINLKRKYKMSLLVIGHTTKRSDSMPIEKNDLQGSSMLMAMTDSAFAMSKSSQDVGKRYIKQIKVRQCQQEYGSNNVVECYIEKENPSNFLRLDWVGFSDEYKHLKIMTAEEKDQLKQYLVKLIEDNPSKSFYELANEATQENLFGQVIYRETLKRINKKYNIRTKEDTAEDAFLASDQPSIPSTTPPDGDLPF